MQNILGDEKKVVLPVRFLREILLEPITFIFKRKGRILIKEVNLLDEAVFLLKGNVLSVQSVDTVNHGLDKLDFRVAETMLVGDIVSNTSLTTRFTAGTTGLESKILAPGLQGGKAFLGPAGQVDVNGSSHASTQVSGAGVQVTQFFVKHEFLARFGLNGVSNSLDTTSQPFENTFNIATCNKGQRRAYFQGHKKLRAKLSQESTNCISAMQENVLPFCIEMILS